MPYDSSLCSRIFKKLFCVSLTLPNRVRRARPARANSSRLQEPDGLEQQILHLRLAELFCVVHFFPLRCFFLPLFYRKIERQRPLDYHFSIAAMFTYPGASFKGFGRGVWTQKR